MTAKDHANPIGCPYCDGKSYGMGPEAREQYKKYHDNGHSWVISQDHAGGVPLDKLRFINSHEHVYLCQDCGMSQEEVTDLANTSPSTNTDLSNPQEQSIAEYKQLLNKLPEKWQINIETSAGIYTPPEVAGHPIEYYQGKNAMLDQCRAIIEARIKELE